MHEVGYSSVDAAQARMSPARQKSPRFWLACQRDQSWRMTGVDLEVIHRSTLRSGHLTARYLVSLSPRLAAKGKEALKHTTASKTPIRILSTALWTCYQTHRRTPLRRVTYPLPETPATALRTICRHCRTRGGSFVGLQRIFESAEPLPAVYGSLRW